MALAPDISGVCSVEDTLEMTSMPTKTLRMKIVSQTTPSFMPGSPSRRASRVASWRICAVVGDARPGDDLVLEVRRERADAVLTRGGHQGQDVDEVLRVEPGGGPGHLRGHVPAAPDLGVADPDHLAGHRALDVAAGLRGQVDDDRAGLHLLDHRAR